MCDEVVLQARDGELTVGERFFDGLLEAVCSSVVSEFSPVSGQTLVEQGFGGAEGTTFGSVSSVMEVLCDSGVRGGRRVRCQAGVNVFHGPL